MKYILIENKGEISEDGLILMGGSSKRNDSSKLGKFGSGCKYSIATFLKMNINFKIFSGINEIKITTQPYIFRETNLDRIFVNGKETSLTVQMGPDWDYAWMALREVLQNSVDEGDMNVVNNIENIEGKEGKTRFYIQIDEQIQEVIDNWDCYFTFDRIDEIETSNNGIIYPNRDINQDLILFSRGIKCTNYRGLKSLYHYFANFEMNESRIIKDDYIGKMLVGKILATSTNKDVIYNVLKNASKQNTYESAVWESWYSIPILNTTWKEVIGSKKIIVEELGGWFEEQQQKYEHFIVKEKLAKRIFQAFGSNIEIFGLSDTGEKVIQKKKVEIDKRKQFLLDECYKFFKEANYNVEFPIEVVQFDNGDQLGLAENNTIFVSEKCFNMGKRELAVTIIEENEHLITKYKDCSRAFQQHFINKYISEMEERIAYFL